LLWCFTATLFVSAGLLFLVQPMLAKMILPLVGGAPEVWNTCMVFFQAALLAGYAYAHLLASRLQVSRQAVIHLGVLLLAAIVLPMGVRDWAPPTGSNPVPALLALLVTCAGLPFFAVAATAPLLQRWFASSGHASANDPYFLYGASNAGSVLALLSYPAFLEPSLRLADQSRIWTAGYAVLILLIAGCAALVSRSRHTPLSPSGRGAGGEGPPREGEDLFRAQTEATQSQIHPSPPMPLPGGERGEEPTVLRRLRWVALAFVPSSLMLGVTTYITTDIAPVPLLWIMPLTLYLFSFILAFGRLPRWVHVVMLCLLPTTILALVYTRNVEIDLKLTQVIALHLATFFVAAMVCHGELAHSRPPTRYLTEFYLWVALGGVLGGAFNALVAPQVFDRVVEYPLFIALPCFLLVRLGRSPDTPAKEKTPGMSAGRATGHEASGSLQFGGSSWAWVVFGVVMGAFLIAPDLSFPAERILYLGRSFFGVLRAQISVDGQFHEMMHGRIVHGIQSVDPKLKAEPLSYYDREGPVGQVFQGISGLGRRKIGVVGLGTGTIAAYAEPGAEVTFFEIDPAVERVARDPQYFTYLTDCEKRHVKLNIVLGDARLQMEKAEKGFGLIVLDAFSSDSIPVHTLTREAFRMYLNKLSDDGVILINVTNRYLDLAPVAGGQAREADLTGLHQNDAVASFAVTQRKRLSCHWAVLARRPEYLGELIKDKRWEPLPAPADKPAWSDDFSNLLGVFRWEASGW
jgi:hypothetical protein